METIEETRIEQPDKSRRTRPTWETILATMSGLKTRLAADTFFQVLRNKACADRPSDETETVENAYNHHHGWAVSAVCHALTATEDMVESPATRIAAGERDKIRMLDLVGVPISMAEEATNSGQNADYGTYTWTFYRLAGKGHVTIRWYGESNGYYSESVTFAEVVDR